MDEQSTLAGDGNGAIGVGVIGATGYIGTPYRREIRETPGFRIVALCARRKDLLQQAGRDDQAALVSDRWQDVVDHPDVDLVVVATPDALHHQAVMRCAETGKHVFCEKPIATSVAEAMEMVQAFRDRNLAHFVPFWTRYVDIFGEAKRIVDSGRLGQIRGVVYRWHNPRPSHMPITWRDDQNLSAGGSIADVGSHAYDTLCWLLQDQATQVLTHAKVITGPKPNLGAINLEEALTAGQSQSFAATSDASEIELQSATTPDYASIAIEFGSRAVGVVVVSHATPLRKGLCPELELHGTDASLAINRVTGHVDIATANGKLEQVANIPDRGLGNRFHRFVLPVVQSIHRGSSAPGHPDLHAGLRVQCFIDAALQSAASGSWQPVVSNPTATDPAN